MRHVAPTLDPAILARMLSTGSAGWTDNWDGRENYLALKANFMRSETSRRNPYGSLFEITADCGILSIMSCSRWFFGGLLTGLLQLSMGQGYAAASVQFNRDIRPILSDNCFACHGFDAKKRKAGLRLDVAEGAYAANKEGRVAIKPGDPASSELWKRLQTSDPDDVMPPPDTHKSLNPEQKKLVRRWIEEGAPYQNHWAFEPILSSTVPSLDQGGKGENPIDRFISARLSQEGHGMSPEANRVTLIRRLSFDLRGLPPTVAEVDTFLEDTRPGAYDRLVKRFLDSPQYGEHMAKFWLDVARYADTHGMHLDNERQMWAYRDWVVGSFNRNLPFDQFTVEQLAGDQLPSPTTDQQIATGFNRCNVTTGEGGSIDAEWLFRYAVDRATTTAQAWLGLTAGCAVCHDHKFDPISAKEFYSLYAFFYSSADPAMDGNALRTFPTVQLKSAEDDTRLKEFDRQIQAAESKISEAVKTTEYRDPAVQIPAPVPRTEEKVWVDDELPGGFTAQTPPVWVTVENGKVFSGKRAVRRQGDGLTQEVYESSSGSLVIPPGAKLYVYVFLDSANPPKAVMLQFNRDNWEHRAVWGDSEAIAWGSNGTSSRQGMGPLPKTGEWIRLEFAAESVGLKVGDNLKGLAYTQFGGTVFWDKAGVVGKVDPANDPLASFDVWSRQNEGKELKELPEDLRKLLKETKPSNWSQAQRDSLRGYYISKICSETRSVFDPLFQKVADVRKQRDAFNDAIPQSFVFKDLDKPRDAFVMIRGAYDKPGEKVEPGVPSILPPLVRNSTNRPVRLDLARWLVSKDNPLTARVTVNRFWQQFFGTGLVSTPDDFGSQGQSPSHPELLDWLAYRFRDSGWDIKELVRLMVTSETYRQSSKVSADLLIRDPQNHLLGRGPRFRLDAEQLRDNVLFVSGLLDRTLGGKGVKPYQPPNIWEPVAYTGSNTRDYKQDTGPSLYRRSLYTFLKRTAPAPFLSTFDAPNREQFCTRRERSNTPLQALQLMNDVQHFEAARSLAQRMLLEGGGSTEDRLRFGYRTVLSRPPTSDELAIVGRALGQHLERYRKDPEAAVKAVTFGDSKPSTLIPAVDLAAYTLTANLLLNLDETVTRN